MVSFYNGKNKDEHAEITTKLEVSLNSLSITADNNFAVVGFAREIGVVGFEKLSDNVELKKKDYKILSYQNQPEVGMVCCNPVFERRNILGSSSNNNILIWDINKEVPDIFSNHLRPIVSMGWSYRDSMLATASSQPHVHFWDFRTNQPEVIKSTEPVHKVSWSQHDESVFATGHGGIVNVWDLRTKKELYSIETHFGKITTLEFGSFHHLNYLLTGSYSELKFWDANNFPEIRLPEAVHNESTHIHCAKLTPFGAGVATVKEKDSIIRTYKIIKNDSENTYHSTDDFGLNTGEKRRTVFSQKEEKVFVQTKTFSGLHDFTKDIAFRKIDYSYQLVSISNDKTIKLWKYDFDFISHFSSNEMGDQPQPLMRSQKKMFLSHENLVAYKNECQKREENETPLEREFRRLKLITKSNPRLKIHESDIIEQKAVISIANDGKFMRLSIWFPDKYPLQKLEFRMTEYHLISIEDINLIINDLNETAREMSRQHKECLSKCIKSFLSKFKEITSADLKDSFGTKIESSNNPTTRIDDKPIPPPLPIYINRWKKREYFTPYPTSMGMCWNRFGDLGFFVNCKYKFKLFTKENKKINNPSDLHNLPKLCQRNQKHDKEYLNFLQEKNSNHSHHDSQDSDSEQIELDKNFDDEENDSSGREDDQTEFKECGNELYNFSTDNENDNENDENENDIENDDEIDNDNEDNENSYNNPNLNIHDVKENFEESSSSEEDVSPSTHVFRQIENINPKKKNASISDEQETSSGQLSPSSFIVVHLGSFIPTSFLLAVNYTTWEKDLQKLCEKNCRICELSNKGYLVNAWNILNISLKNIATDPLKLKYWNVHSLGYSILTDILKTFQSMGDIQSLGVFSFIVLRTQLKLLKNYYDYNVDVVSKEINKESDEDFLPLRKIATSQFALKEATSFEGGEYTPQFTDKKFGFKEVRKDKFRTDNYHKFSQYEKSNKDSTESFTRASAIPNLSRKDEDFYLKGLNTEETEKLDLNKAEEKQEASLKFKDRNLNIHRFEQKDFFHYGKKKGGLNLRHKMSADGKQDRNTLNRRSISKKDINVSYISSPDPDNYANSLNNSLIIMGSSTPPPEQTEHNIDILIQQFESQLEATQMDSRITNKMSNLYENNHTEEKKKPKKNKNKNKNEMKNMSKANRSTQGIVDKSENKAQPSNTDKIFIKDLALVKCMICYMKGYADLLHSWLLFNKANEFYKVISKIMDHIKLFDPAYESSIHQIHDLKSTEIKPFKSPISNPHLNKPFGLNRHHDHDVQTKMREVYDHQSAKIFTASPRKISDDEISTSLNLKHILLTSERSLGYQIQGERNCYRHCEGVQKYKCLHCSTLNILCCLCHKKLRGVFALCTFCNHGGHFKHLRDWFEKESVCPVGGCGCNCISILTIF